MDNVYTIVKPFYILSKVLGTFPLSFDGPPQKRFLVTKWYDVVTPLILPGISILLIVLNALLINDNEVLYSVWRINGIFGCCLVILQFGWQMKKFKSVPKFLEALNTFDRKVKRQTKVICTCLK